jgi:N-methylhydantoinase B/acetone carboxylase, alpha subunit
VNYVEVLRTDGAKERFAFATNVKVNEGDVIRLVTGNGGGFGNPKDRSRAEIERDLRNEYLTPARAKEIYGYEA